MKAADIFDVTDKVAFITGAAQGLGREMAQVLADNGAVVWLFDRDADLLRTTAVGLRAGGAQVTTVAGDVTDDAAVRGAVADIVSHHGRLDICIANAGITDAVPGLTHQIQDDDWARVMAVNVTGTMQTCRAALAQMQRQGWGKVMTVASMWGLAAPAGAFPRPGVAASKAAIINLSREMALHYARDNIQVNVLCPGIIQTGGRPRDPAAAIAYTPMGRLGRPQEIAGATLFLASAASDFMTGATLVVDGGVLAR
jgi:NAD(P)-dependent dehydrogenase (short-subunit alcohol dehydrogenase family)